MKKLFANDKGGQSLKTLPALLAKYRQLVRLAIVQLITKAKYLLLMKATLQNWQVVNTSFFFYAVLDDRIEAMYQYTYR